ncbi:MAG: DUF6588 family protein [Candidatus Firestonebacteria bacterium]
MRYIKFILCIVLVVFFCSKAIAVSFSEFQNYLSETYLKPFSKDLGAILGGGFYTGSNCGFPGFDVSAKFILIDKPIAEDRILPQNQSFGLPYIQAEVGLPLGLGVMARGFSFSVDAKSFSVIGAGLKYKFLEDVVAIPAVSGFVTYNFVAGFPDFDASTFSLNVLVSKGFSPLPLSVYAVGGLDFTNITSKIAGFLDVKGSDSGYRINTGVRFSPFPLFYVVGDIGFVNGSTNYNAGAGISF